MQQPGGSEEPRFSIRITVSKKKIYKYHGGAGRGNIESPIHIGTNVLLDQILCLKWPRTGHLDVLGKSARLVIGRAIQILHFWFCCCCAIVCLMYRRLRVQSHSRDI